MLADHHGEVQVKMVVLSGVKPLYEVLHIRASAQFQARLRRVLFAWALRCNSHEPPAVKSGNQHLSTLRRQLDIVMHDQSALIVRPWLSLTSASQRWIE